MRLGDHRQIRIALPFALVLALMLSVLPAPRPASAGSIDGTTWTSDIADVSISWDDRVFEAEADDGDGYERLYLSTEDGYFMNFVLFPDGYDDAQECLDAYRANLEQNESNSDLTSARRATVPESDPDAVGEVITYVFTTSSNQDVELISYIECREADGAFLTLEAYAIADVYEDAVPDYEDVLASIEAGGGGGRQNDDEENGDSGTGEAGIDGNVYTSGLADVTVTWDDRIWEGEFEQVEKDVETLSLGADGYFMRFFIYKTEFADSDECLDQMIANLEAGDGIEDVRKDRRATAPESDPDASSVVLTYLYTNPDGEEYELTNFHECRDLGDNIFMTIQAFTTSEMYEDVVPDFEDVLAGIEVGGGGRNKNDDQTDDGGAAEAGIDGNVYTSGLADVTVTWDDRIWEGENTIVSKDIEMLMLSADGYYMRIVIYRSEFADVDECLDTMIGTIEDGESNSDVRVARRAPSPETDPDAASEVISYVFTTSEGDELEITDYLECREVGDGLFMNIQAYTTADLYEDAVPDFEDVLAGIEVGASGGRTSGGGNEDCEIDDTANPVEGCITDYAVEYDDRVWMVLSALYAPDEYDSIVLSSDSGLVATLITRPDAAGDPEPCVEGRVATLEDEADGRVVRRAELPETDRDAFATVVSYVVTTEDGEEFDLYEYIECRPVGEGYLMQISIMVSPDAYEDSIPDIEDLLAGIEPGTGDGADSGSGGGSDDADEADQDTGRGSGGSTFVGENYGVEIDFGNDWEIVDSGKQGRVDYVYVSNGVTTGYLFFTDQYAGDTMQCQQEFVNTWAAADGVSNFVILEGDSGVVYQNDADYAFGGYSMTRNRDPYVVLIACVDAGDFRLAIVTESAEEDAEQMIEDYQALLELIAG